MSPARTGRCCTSSAPMPARCSPSSTSLSPPAPTSPSRCARRRSRLRRRRPRPGATASSAASPPSPIVAKRRAMRSSSRPVGRCARRCPTRAGAPRLSPSGNRSVSPSSLAPASCSGHERRVPPPRRAGAPLCVARAVLSRAVPDRAQDQLGRDRDRRAALHAAPRSRRRRMEPPPDPRRLPVPVLRQPVSARLSQRHKIRGRVDARLPAARLSHGLRHRARAARLAWLAAAAGHPALLDQLPDPRLRLDRPAERQRRHQQPAARDGPHPRAAGAPQQRLRRLSRHRLFLSAVHGAAALCPARGSGRSRLPAVAGLRSRDAAAVAAGHRRRRAARLHSRGRRVRHPRPARRPGHLDDRQGAVGRVLHQPRLAGGIGRRRRHAGAAARADGLRPPPAAGRDRMINRLSPFLAVMLAVGYVFLYGPIASLILYSFNASRLVTVWAGFSTHWYVELAHNEAIRRAALVSIEIAVSAASGALVLGTLAGFALQRYRRFRGRALFGTLVTAPLVMPEVITGLSLLLLFVALEQALGWPAGRSMLTIIIAHVTLGTAYVAVVVEARLAAFDRSLEEAALDLGARPMKVFFVITLPLIAPALLAGWLLAFTLSLDDLVIASFTSGPSSTTLPMVIFSSVRLGVSPQINALATLFLATVTVTVLIAGRLIGGPARRREKARAPAPAAQES